MEKGKQWVRKNLYWGVSLLLFAGIIMVLLLLKQVQRENYRVVCLGDSIIGNVRDNTSITAYMEAECGVAVYNGAFGGTTASCKESENRAAKDENILSLVKLTDAICYENFSVQNAGVKRFASMDYFAEAMYGFDKIDWSEVEILVIEHGVNDYLTGAAVDNPVDPYDVTTYGGALRHSLRQLQTMRPDLRIILCTPTYCWFLVKQRNCEEVDLGGGYLEDYVSVELEIAKEFGVEIVDNYHESGIGGEFENWSKYTSDGLHLNENGRRLVAQRISAVIMGDAK